MSVALITGSGGLVGSEASRHFADIGFEIVGVDNDFRSVFFGSAASVAWQIEALKKELGSKYLHYSIDIRNEAGINDIFSRFGHNITLVIHAAAQPSHDWAARDPKCDFSVNAIGTLNMLEGMRVYASQAAFIYTSTNKVYGDRPNSLPLIEQQTRWELDPQHTYFSGIREDMSIDLCLHSLFGASKAAADILVQEYGRYFGLKTACFRGGCLTGPNHSGAQLHGFLAYLVKCGVTGVPYTIYGYKGKQVRDNIHSRDLILAFDAFRKAPRIGEVYNIGGGRKSNCSVLEAVAVCQEITGREMTCTYSEENRIGDHIWWISDVGRFHSHYPDWQVRCDVKEIVAEIYENNRFRWTASDAQ